MPIFSKGESKDKLSILYYLRVALLELTREQLYRAMVENDCMGFFEFQVAMNELEEDRYLVAIPRAFGQGYRITLRGEEILDMLCESLPFSYREKLKAYAEDNREKMRIETQLVSTMEEQKNGTYHVTLKAQSREAVELELHLNMASREMAKRVRKNWADEKTSAEIYLFLLNRLLKEPDEQEIPPEENED